ncbi:MAG: type II secretion system protein [Acholeplasmataceae bacterium]|nr:type II secretion system protein [Acholeplasmataceae bacterium]
MFKSFIKQEKGFTLIEVVAVLAIIGVMALTLTPSIDVAANRAKDTRMLSDLVTLDSAVKLYCFEHDNSYPETLEVLKGGYVPDKDYKDAKNQPFAYSKSDSGSYSLTGSKTNGDVVKADGTTVEVNE